MAIKQALIDLDKYYESITDEKLILNDYSIYDFNHSKHFYNTMVNEFESDTVNLLPKCNCRYTVGEYYLGTICPKCGTKVKRMNYDPVVWAKAFNDNLKFLNPTYTTMLNDVLKNDISFLIGLTNEPRTSTIRSFMQRIAVQVMGGKRSYSMFISKLDDILDFLITRITSSRSANRRRKEYDRLMLLQNWLRYEPNKVFSTYIPMINNVMFNVTKTNKGKFVDTGLSSIFDVASSWMKVSNDAMVTEDELDRCTGRAVLTLSGMVKYYIDTYLKQKSGVFRKHVYGARSPFTFRTVITSIPGPHRHDDVIAPWLAISTVFRPFVLNKLMNSLNLSYKEASLKMYRSSKRYDADIDMIVNELLDETTKLNPDGRRGIPVLVQRNPSLRSGSAQKLYIKEFDTDPTVFTMGFSTLICKAPNADFDGDELNVYLLPDRYMANLFERFNPYYNIPDFEPYSVSGKVSLLPLANNIMLEYLKNKSDHPEQDKILKDLL